MYIGINIFAIKVYICAYILLYLRKILLPTMTLVSHMFLLFYGITFTFTKKFGRIYFENTYKNIYCRKIDQTFSSKNVCMSDV